MNILFILLFIILYEVFAIAGGFVMAIFPNWVVITMCEVAIGFGTATLVKKIFSKKNISNLSLYVCLLAPIIGCGLNIYTNGFSLSLLWYNLIGCVSVYAGLFELQ